MNNLFILNNLNNKTCIICNTNNFMEQIYYNLLNSSQKFNIYHIIRNKNQIRLYTDKNYMSFIDIVLYCNYQNNKYDKYLIDETLSNKNFSELNVKETICYITI